MSTELEKKFNLAVKYVQEGMAKDQYANSNKELTDDDRLLFYAFFKQATEGDVKGSQPYAIQFVARAKWDAWNKVKGMSKEDAMQQYVDLLTQMAPEWYSYEGLNKYK
ncbi:hypothetical protein FDP41_012318 [Naegleria fowleri]|uniref:ACB domain-containing protein n=1 Tax=Naegleria fowleri TaxID=5763 RepID=A0A6A5C3L6_NAEFO|nr:uncharacterized protein FDP41_012318 [Naegleria fowleri]KAF0981661.1 hypothetical protein FDP41_012318 [Naegleria fowleri]CAG4719226.1 unnamed protein product [Naegleria fowleri]